MKRLGLVLLTVAGCAKTDSSNLLTDGMHAAMTAKAGGDGTTEVSATLFVGNPLNLNFVELTGDDRLLAGHNGQFKPMTEIIVLNIVGHSATFDVDDEGAEFEVDFVRSIDDGASESFTTLPAPFALDPLPTSTVSRAAALTVSWSPSGTGYRMRWQVRGDCIEDEYQDLATDTGSATIEANRIRKRMGDGVADSCPVTLEVSRIEDGTVDPAFGEGGTFHGIQYRRMMITSTP